jgi:hypothetical protein
LFGVTFNPTIAMDLDEKEALKEKLKEKLLQKFFFLPNPESEALSEAEELEFHKKQLEFENELWALFRRMKETFKLQKYFESHNLPKLEKMMKKKYKAQEKKVQCWHKDNNQRYRIRDQRNATRYRSPTIEENIEREKLMNEFRALFD